MELKREVEYRLAKWIFANLYHQGKIDEQGYEKIIDRLMEKCDPPMKTIEERYVTNEQADH